MVKRAMFALLLVNALALGSIPLMTTAPAVAALPGPTFITPVDGQTLKYCGSLDCSLVFKVRPVDRASGYLWGFFRDGRMVWENYRDEHQLSGPEYVIRGGTAAHGAIGGPGGTGTWQIQVSVRALVNGQWTNATVITVTLVV